MPHQQHSYSNILWSNIKIILLTTNAMRLIEKSFNRVKVFPQGNSILNVCKYALNATSE